MLPQEIPKQVKRIQIETGRQVADVFAGAYLSVFRGRGMEFDEVRPYVPGDDVRTIDWNVTARYGAPYIKRYVEERELTVLLVVDVSPSQEFGSGRRSKREAVAELSAILAFSAIENDDRVGLLLFHDETEEYIPPRKGQKHALRVIREVVARDRASRKRTNLSRWERLKLWKLGLRRRAESQRSTNIGFAMEFCRQVLRRRAVVFLMSDFLDEGYMSALRSAHRRHDVVAVHVVDERERVMPETGLVTLQDAETGETRFVDTASAAFRAALQARSQKRLQALEADLRASGVDLLRIDASQSIVEPLLRFFAMRHKRLCR